MNKAASASLQAGTSLCIALPVLHDELGWIVKAGLTPLDVLTHGDGGPANSSG
jgi:hypothetical protein